MESKFAASSTNFNSPTSGRRRFAVNWDRSNARLRGRRGDVRLSVGPRRAHPHGQEGPAQSRGDTGWTIEPSEAAIVLRVFRSFTGGSSASAILRALNEEGVASRRSGRGHWAPATIHRILRNEKYVAHWVWNKTRSRREPRTGRQRKFTKPVADWVVNVDEALRIVPQGLLGGRAGPDREGGRYVARR